MHEKLAAEQTVCRVDPSFAAENDRAAFLAADHPESLPRPRRLARPGERRHNSHALPGSQSHGL